jgi:hypothetical protein
MREGQDTNGRVFSPIVRISTFTLWKEVASLKRNEGQRFIRAFSTSLFGGGAPPAGAELRITREFVKIRSLCGGQQRKATAHDECHGPD